MSKITHQIILRNERNENEYIVLSEHKSQKTAEYMLKWYESHHQFFNGEFSIREV